MMNPWRCFALAATVALIAGCTKPFVVTQPLSESLTAPATIAIGEVKDELPVDLEPQKKPKEEEFRKLRVFLGEEIAKKELWKFVPEATAATAQYEVQGSFLEFKRGSGAARFFIGFGVGNSKATIGLRLIDKSSGATVFAGNFTGQVTSWAESGDQAFRRIAHDFAKELEKQMKKPKKAS
jgi:hypothetical protein